MNLTESQIANWRIVMTASLGPYGLICEDSYVVAFASFMKAKLEQAQERYAIYFAGTKRNILVNDGYATEKEALRVLRKLGSPERLFVVSYFGDSAPQCTDKE